jgi:hypothetical protein
MSRHIINILAYICPIYTWILGAFIPKSVGEFNIDSVNLVWGTVYGVGWKAADYLLGFSSATSIIGFAVWPIIVLIGGYFIVVRSTLKIRATVVALCALTSLFNVSAETALSSYADWPIYYVILYAYS